MATSKEKAKDALESGRPTIRERVNGAWMAPVDLATQRARAVALLLAAGSSAG